jgi:hypothetical protein
MKVFKVIPYNKKWKKRYRREFGDQRDARQYLRRLDSICIDAFIEEVRR